MVEFALVFPVLMLIVGGIIQFGIVFWAQNTLTQVTRDTGRWASTQQFNPCSSGSSQVVDQANAIAGATSLIGYTSPWSAIAFASTARGVAVEWAKDSGAGGCPPSDNQSVWYVTVKINTDVPVFFPLVSGAISSEAKFRMEPAPAP
jgi:Flp pilus assembly protein TadG